MIDQQNYLDVKEYLHYLAQIGKDEQSVAREWNFLRHLLEWADDKPFYQARLIDPSFQTYVETARNDSRDIPVSPSSIKKACEAARRFFSWVRELHPKRYSKLNASWVRTIQPSTAKGLHSRRRNTKYFKIEQVRAIARFEPLNLRQERDIAAVCFLFLSAMRISAFCSLPIKAVDLEALTVEQDPDLGVMTKNRKAERTHLLPIADLVAVVRAWDAKIKAEGLTGDDLWYPKVDTNSRSVMRLDRERRGWKGRTSGFTDGLIDLCERAGVPYLSPHKLRDGHGVYVYPKIKTMEQLKALSQNMMHENAIITDTYYANIVSDRVGELYEGLGDD